MTGCFVTNYTTYYAHIFIRSQWQSGHFQSCTLVRSEVRYKELFELTSTSSLLKASLYFKKTFLMTSSALQCFRETLPGQEAVLQGALADGGPGHPLGGELGAVPV